MLVKKNKLEESIESIFNKNQSFIIILTLFFCFSICSLFNHNFIIFVVSLMLTGSMLFDFESNVIIFLFTYPFEIIFCLMIKSEVVNIFPYIYAIMFVIQGIKYVIFNLIKGKQKLNLKIIVPMIVFLLYIIMPFYKIKVSDFLKYCVAMGMLYLLYEKRYELDLKKIKKYAFIGLILSCTLSFILRLYNIYEYAYFDFYSCGILKFQGMFRNPNYLMMYVCVLSTIIKWDYIVNNDKNSAIQLITVFAINYATLSRNFLLCEILSVIILFIYVILRKDKKMIKRLFLTIFYSAGLMLLMFNYTKVYYIRFKSSLIQILKKIGISVSDSSVSNSNLSSFDAGIKTNYPMQEVDSSRLAIWKTYFSSFTKSVKSIIFGYGISSQILGIKTHNTYIYGLWLLGVVGCVILLYLIGIMLFDKKQKNSFIFWLILISFLFISFFESNLLNTLFLIVFILLSATKRRETEKYE